MACMIRGWKNCIKYPQQPVSSFAVHMSGCGQYIDLSPRHQLSHQRPSCLIFHGTVYDKYIRIVWGSTTPLHYIKTPHWGQWKLSENNILKSSFFIQKFIYFVNDSLRSVFLEESVWFKCLLNLNLKVQMDNTAALILAPDWRRKYGKPLRKPMMIQVVDACVIMPQWVECHNSE